MASLKYNNSNSLGHKRDLAPIGCGDWDLSSTLVSGRLQHHESQQSEKLFSAALKYLEDKVDPARAPELFMSMAYTPECDRAFRTLSSQHAMDPSLPLPPLDPRAVAAVALRCLSPHGTLHLITQVEASTLITPFLQTGNDLVRVSVAAHLVNRLPEARRSLLRRFIRYLKRLATLSDTCSVPGLAQAVGPALLQPERLSVGVPPTGLTAATVHCAMLLIHEYERLFQETLPDEKRQKRMQEQIRRLILRKKEDMAVAKDGSSTKVPGRLPEPIINPITTLPDASITSKRILRPPSSSLATPESPALLQQPWKPSGSVFRGIRPPSASSSSSGATPRRLLNDHGGDSSAIKNLGSISAKPSPTVEAARRGLNVNLPTTLLRQIELKSKDRGNRAKNSTPKSPWRPPGKNEKFATNRRVDQCGWTPTIDMKWRMSDSSEFSEVSDESTSITFGKDDGEQPDRAMGLRKIFRDEGRNYEGKKLIPSLPGYLHPAGTVDVGSGHGKTTTARGGKTVTSSTLSNGSSTDMDPPPYYVPWANNPSYLVDGMASVPSSRTKTSNRPSIRPAVGGITGNNDHQCDENNMDNNNVSSPLPTHIPSWTAKYEGVDVAKGVCVERGSNTHFPSTTDRKFSRLQQQGASVTGAKVCNQQFTSARVAPLLSSNLSSAFVASGWDLLNEDEAGALERLFVDQSTGQVLMSQPPGEGGGRSEKSSNAENQLVPLGMTLKELLRAADEYSTHPSTQSADNQQYGAKCSPLELAIKITAHAKQLQRGNTQLGSSSPEKTKGSQWGLLHSMHLEQGTRQDLQEQRGLEGPRSSRFDAVLEHGQEINRQGVDPIVSPIADSIAEGKGSVNKSDAKGKRAPPPPPPPLPPSKQAASKKAGGAPPPPPPPLPPSKQAAARKAAGAPPPPPPPLPVKSAAKKSVDKHLDAPDKEPSQPSDSTNTVDKLGAKENMELQENDKENEQHTRRRLKQLHWDKIKAVKTDTIWYRATDMENPTRIDFEELENLFQILETTAAKKVGKPRQDEVRLIEHRRAHNISIELSGIRKPFADIKDALVRMDDSELTVEQLQALSRAVPDETEKKEIELYLEGKHPKYFGISDPNRMGTVERYFNEIKDIPRIGERIHCLLFARTFEGTRSMCQNQLALVQDACSQLKTCEHFLKLLQAVLELGNHLNAGTHRGSAAGFKLDTLLRLADVKGIDRKTSLLQFVVQQLQSSDPELPSLSQEMCKVRPAATLQLSAVSALMGEMRVGLRRVKTEMEKAARESDEIQVATSTSSEGQMFDPPSRNEATRQFAKSMAKFYEAANHQFSELEGMEGTTKTDLKATTEYFGEEYVVADPLRIVRIVRDFMLLHEKVVKQLSLQKAAKADPKVKATTDNSKASLAEDRAGTETESTKLPESEPSLCADKKPLPSKSEPEEAKVCGDENQQQESGSGLPPMLDCESGNPPSMPDTPEATSSAIPSPCKASPPSRFMEVEQTRGHDHDAGSSVDSAGETIVQESMSEDTIEVTQVSP